MKREPTPEDYTVADSLGPCAVGVLTETHYRSFCTGCDELEAKGLIDSDGQESEQAERVKEIWRVRLAGGIKP